MCIILNDIYTRKKLSCLRTCGRGLGTDIRLCCHFGALLTELWPVCAFRGRSRVSRSLSLRWPKPVGYMDQIRWAQFCLSAMDLDRWKPRAWLPARNCKPTTKLLFTSWWCNFELVDDLKMFLNSHSEELLWFCSGWGYSFQAIPESLPYPLQIKQQH